MTERAEIEPDAWGNYGEEETCMTCDGSGREYGETCVTCGGLGWTCWPSNDERGEHMETNDGE